MFNSIQFRKFVSKIREGWHLKDNFREREISEEIGFNPLL